MLIQKPLYTGNQQTLSARLIFPDLHRMIQFLIHLQREERFRRAVHLRGRAQLRDRHICAAGVESRISRDELQLSPL